MLESAQKRKTDFVYLLLGRLFQLLPDLRFSFYLHFWNNYQNLKTLKIARIMGLIRFAVNLLKLGLITAKLLKQLDFRSLDGKQRVFNKLLMARILSKVDERVLVRQLDNLKCDDSIWRDDLFEYLQKLKTGRHEI